MRESELLRLVMDWLSAKHILAFRMNTGAFKMDQRFIHFGVIGMADVLAFDHSSYPAHGSGFISLITPTWIELKVGRNAQSEFQKSFQKLVESEGHRYLVVRDLADLQGVLD